MSAGRAMRLQDLKDDLTRYEPPWVGPCSVLARLSDPVFVVARRVADLYDECPKCAGRGETIFARRIDGDRDIRVETKVGPCSCCLGTGAMPGDKTEGLAHDLLSLARYLFGGTHDLGPA